MTERWTGPENDYRRVLDLESRPLAVAVVIPAYNRPDVLARTLAGFVAQRRPADEIVVADDGSEEDLAAVVAAFESSLPVGRVHRQHRGFGAGPARNLGAAATSSPVLLFVDSDCIPHPDLVARHADWHGRASNLVVAGSRVHIDAGAWIPDDLATGTVDLASAAKTPLDAEGAAPPEDWRRPFARRSRQLLIGDEAFRTAISNNLSMHRTTFDAAGGFSNRFTTWGGEDTELAWRVWNEGTFVVPENRAVVYHQTQDDPPGDQRRPALRRRVRPLVADLVPHRFYRPVPSPLSTVPKVSWVVHAPSAEALRRALRVVADDRFADVELIVWGPQSVLADIEAVAPSSDRTTIAENHRAAVEAARGELVVAYDGRARVGDRLLRKAVARLDADPRASVVRCAYRVDGDVYRRFDDLAAVDEAAGDGAPLWAVARRRELMKDPALLDDAKRGWAEAMARSRIEHLINDHVGLGELVLVGTPAGRPIGLAEARGAGPRELARAAVRTARRLRAATPPVADRDRDTTAPEEAPVRIDYIGYTGAGNLGDEAILEAVRRLLPWASVERDQKDAAVLMVGGGTLINGRNYYLTRVLRRDTPAEERVLFGPGVRSPEYWGVTEPMAEWSAFIRSSLYAGVRGERSRRHLADMGVVEQVDVLGDPALSLIPAPIDRVPGKVVVCPVHTGDNLWGGSDAAVFERLAATIRRLRAAGHEVEMLSAFPHDDRWIIELMRQADAPGMPYVGAHGDVELALRTLASAELVIGERLHATILAAACDTPFVPIEYRPKVGDFAESVGVADLVVRTDDLGRLDEVVDRLLADPEPYRTTVAEAVNVFRTHQRSVAQSIRHRLGTADDWKTTGTK